MITILLSCSEKKNSPDKVDKHLSNDYQRKINDLFHRYDDSQFMGSVILTKEGEIVYQNTFGFSDIKTKKKANSDTRYRIGSVTKTFTAVLILKAVEEKKLSLNEPIDKYFPSVKNAHKITISHLLKHRSGIHNFTSDKWFYNNRTNEITSEQMLSKISNYGSDFEPNIKGEYSNSNYFLLALILEEIYDVSYDSLLLTKICTPLDLINTYSGTEINIDKNESYSYLYNDKWIEFPETHLSTAKGTGSIISTTEDLNSFFESLLTGEVLSTESLELMKTIEDRFGMGLFRYKINDRIGYGHRGRIDEFRSTSIYFPDEKLSLTLNSNGSRIDINEIYTEIFKLYLNDAEVEISETDVTKFVGVYVSENDPNQKSVFIQDKNVLINFIKNEFKEPLIYKGNNRFVLEQMYAESISFIFSADGKEMIFEQGGNTWKYTKK